MSVDGVGIDTTKPNVRSGARVVATLVRPHWVPFAVSVFGAAMFALGTVVSAAVLGWVVDDVVIATFAADEGADVGAVPSVFAAAAAVLAVVVLRSVGVVTRRYYAGMTSERVERTTRAGLAKQYLGQPMSWLRTVPTGRLVAHVDADAHQLVHALHPLPFSFGVLFLAIFSGIRLFAIDPSIALIALVVFPIMVVVNSVYSRVVEPPMTKSQAHIATLAGIAHESFEGAMIVKTLGRQAEEVERFDSSAGDLEHTRRQVGFIRAYLDAVLSGLPLLSTLIVVLVGVRRIQAGAMSAGDLVEVAALFSALAIPMLVFGFLLESLIPSVVVWNRLRPVLDAPIPGLPEERGVELGVALPVQVDGLSYAFPDRPDEQVLEDINLTVAAGEIVAVVGPTGGGKSTLCRALAGVLDEVGDVVHVGGRSLASMHPADRSAIIAYAFQEPFLFAGSIRSNIDIDGTNDDESIERAGSAAAIDEWIATMPKGYDTIIGERGVTVSGGQRQRIALARALVRRAGLVVLDDATSAVDVLIEEQILSALRGAEDVTMVIVANRLATVERADRVVYLAGGRIVATGSHEELLANEQYRELVLAYAEVNDG